MKTFGFCVAAILIALFQVGFVSALPYPWNALNVLLCGVIFLGIVFDYRSGILFAFTAGFAWDIYHGSFFGGYAVALLVTLIVLHAVFENVFTNRSLFTLMALGAAGTLLFNILFALIHFSVFSEIAGVGFFVFFGYQFFLNLLCLIAAFFIVHVTSKKFQSIFLSR